MIIENLQIPKVVQENFTDMIKLYIRYGPDYSLIAKEFQGIVEEKISTKFVSQFCFNLNKKTYQIIVDYLKQHKQQKGEKQFNYDNLWPQTIDDPELRAEIEKLPTDIIRILNKDLSQAYNLLMESLSDPTLKKLIIYDRVRDLYQFVTQIILKKTNKSKKDRKEKKDSVKQTPTKKPSTKTVRNVQKIKEQQDLKSQNQWSTTEERYLCALYIEAPLFKCCEKMKQKFGQSQKWNTTRKIFKKAEEIFQKSLKKALKSSHFKSLKQILEALQMNKENLIAQIIKKKSNLIQKSLLKFYRTNDNEKKAKSIQQINTEMFIILEKPEILKKITQQGEVVSKQEEKVKEQQQNFETKQEQQEFTQQLQTKKGAEILLQNFDEIKIEIKEQVKAEI